MCPAGQASLYTTPMTDTEDAEASLGSEEVTIVLAAVDTSTLASRVVDLAAQMARRTWTHAQLHLVHVFRAGRFDRPSRVGLRSEDLAAEAQSYLDYHVRMARRQYPAPVTGHFAQGDPADEILKCARVAQRRPRARRHARSRRAREAPARLRRGQGGQERARAPCSSCARSSARTSRRRPTD